MVSIRLACGLVFAVILAVFAFSANAAFRKPPFNGSIFGKRASTVTDYEVASRALSALCEAASETCGTWISRQEAN